jgi:outer membrane protein assembly factor BamC
MTIRKTAFIPSQRTLVVGALVTTLTSLSGCGMLGSVIGNDKVDYKSAKKASTLDVPPDLTQLQKDNRYALPDSNNGVATASGYNASKAAQSGALNQATVVVPGQPQAGTVAQTSLSDIKVERDGNQRWLVIKQTPEQLWPQLKQFWEDSGFTLAQELPAAGIMETEWNENRAKIPQDFIRNTIGKVFDSVYSSGERDKFRTRIERRADGSSEIYISHRGVQEVAVGSEKESTKWMPRANDPGLEAEFLSRLLNKLGNGSEQLAQAKTAVEGAAVQPQHASLVGAGADRAVQVDEGFDRAWRRVGLALDRAGFTVEDRDRTQGIYFVRYINDATETKGFFSKLFSWGSSSDEADKEAQRYRISVKAAEGNTSVVKVLSNAGKEDNTPVGEKILTLLHEQLK